MKAQALVVVFSLILLCSGTLLVTPASAVSDFQLVLEPGWNFISTPGVLSAGYDTAGMVFSGVDTGNRPILLYDSGAGTWTHMEYTSPVKPLDGIWIYSTHSANLVLHADGDETQSLSKQLYTGWNAIGFPASATKPVREELFSLRNQWVDLLGFDAGLQGYDPSILNGEETGTHRDTVAVSRGKGYWLYLSQPAALVFAGTSPFETSPVTHSFFFMNDGTRQSLEFTTYGGLASRLAAEDHTYYSDLYREVWIELFSDPDQEMYLLHLIDSLKEIPGDTDGQAKAAISLVQHIPYDYGKASGNVNDLYFPYETLHNEKGVCGDKSILTAYLLSRLGYETVLLEFPGHMAVGVKCDPQYDFYDTGYAFVETTRPVMVTYVPDTYSGGFRITPDPGIIPVPGGTKQLDVSREYADAVEFTQLLSMGPQLDQYHYQRWLDLSARYDLMYET